MTRDRLALLLLAPLLAVILYVAAMASWHSCPSVDCRTYVEMVRGICDHGLPYSMNGPVGLYPELQARWNVVHHGRLWGTYPPAFPYVAAIPFLLGGLPGIARFNGALLAVLALGVFALGRRYTRDPMAGTAAAYLVVASTPACASSLDLGPYIMAVTLITWASFFTLSAIDEAGVRAHRLAFVAGLLAALALGTHLLNLPLFASMLVALAAIPVEGSPPLVPVSFRGSRFVRFAPTHASVRRGAWGFAGAFAPVFLMALLNHLRFGSWNPITYGPCAWRSCEETGLAHQSAGAMVMYAALTIIWASVTTAFAWRLRGSRRGLAILAVLSVVALFGYGPLRRHTFNILSIFWGYFVDASPLDMSPMFRPADGLGNMFGPFVIKSTLQCTPLVALAALAPFTARRDRRATLAVALPAIGLFVLLSLRANLSPVQALGFSFLYLRYVLPALPLLVVLAIGAVKDLPWTWKHLLFIAGATLLLGVCINQAPDDLPYWRRALILRVTLAAGAGALLLTILAHTKNATLAWRNAAALVTAIAVALGVAITLTIDLSVSLGMQREGARMVDNLARVTPQRFALVGWGSDIDTLLTLRASRDIEYVDLYESENWFDFRLMIDRWAEERRPIFAVLPWHAGKSPWADVEFELIDPPARLYRISKRGDSAP